MNVVFRVDASNEIGAGHVVRCKVLAKKLLERGHHCSFVCADLKGNHISMLKKDGYKVYSILPKLNEIKNHNEANDIISCKNLVLFEKVDWVIVDHYYLGFNWQAFIKSLNVKLFVIDDRIFTSINADIFLNQNFKNNQKIIINNKKCIHLIGPKYVLIRAEFQKNINKSLLKKKQQKLQNLFICMGGGDSFKETIEAIEGVINANKFWETVNIIVGKACSNINFIENIVKDKVGWSLHVQTKKIAKLLRDADLAITGGGSICWEKCILGVPSLVKIIEENQRSNSNILEKMGCHIVIKTNKKLASHEYSRLINELDLKRNYEMSLKSSLICDSLGSLRIVVEMEKYFLTNGYSNNV